MCDTFNYETCSPIVDHFAVFHNKDGSLQYYKWSMGNFRKILALYGEISY